MKKMINNVVDDDRYFDQMDTSEFLNMSYDKQQKIKDDFVKTTFEHTNLNGPIEHIISSKHPLYYRHKVTATATNIKVNGKLLLKLGFFIENTHKINPHFESVLHDKAIEKALKDIEAILQKNRFTAYVKGHDRGVIKHVLIRKSYHNEEMLLVFVTKDYLFPNKKTIIQEIRQKNPYIKSVVQIIQKQDTPIVLYGEAQTLYGPGYIIDEIDGLTFKLSAKSFYQVNPEQMMKLYHKAFELADIKKMDHVMDCYSGIGTLSLLAGQKAKSVIGVEVNSSAVKDAIENAKRNHMNHVTFINDDVEKYMSQYQGKIDVCLIDPPRIGASMGFIEALKRLKPKKIVYISCFVETQARDLRQLSQLYNTKMVQPVDMFPYTPHVESITLLSLK